MYFIITLKMTHKYFPLSLESNKGEEAHPCGVMDSLSDMSSVILLMENNCAAKLDNFHITFLLLNKLEIYSGMHVSKFAYSVLNCFGLAL